MKRQVLKFWNFCKLPGTLDRLNKALATKLHSIDNFSPEASGAGTSERPPDEIGKIGVENWCCFLWVYTSAEEAEIPEIFGKNMKKINFS